MAECHRILNYQGVLLLVTTMPPFALQQLLSLSSQSELWTIDVHKDMETPEKTSVHYYSLRKRVPYTLPAKPRLEGMPCRSFSDAQMPSSSDNLHERMAEVLQEARDAAAEAEAARQKLQENQAQVHEAMDELER